MPTIRPFAFPRPSLVAALVLFASLACTGARAQDGPVRVQLTTTEGDIVLELDERRAPHSVDNFLDYVEAGFYDGTIFHRVIDGFMIQGGGFTADFERKRTEAPIRNEANNGLSNERLTIAMARTNAPHSATAQFFINTVDNRNLDHTGQTPRGWGYAVFGRVVDGRDVVERISRVPTGAGGPFSRDAPREPVVIVEASRLAAPGVPASGDAIKEEAPAAADDGETTSAAEAERKASVSE